MIISGKNNEYNGGKCINTAISINIVPRMTIKVPIFISSSSGAFLASCADKIKPMIKPIGGNKFAIPYSELVIPSKLMATNGARAPNT